MFEICLGSQQMPRHIYVFQYLPQQKKCQGNWILRNLKNFFSNNKKISTYFCLKKRNVMLNKKRYFYFLHDFQTFMTQLFTVLTADVCLLFLYFWCSCILVSKTWGIERMLTLLYQYKWQKFNKMNEKRSLGYQSVGAEYVTGQISGLILLLLLRQF